jgi:hypothetical protein
MKSLRTVANLLTAFALLSLAHSAQAGPTKLYSLKTCVGVFDSAGVCQIAQAQQPGAPTTVTPIVARIFNESPPTSNSQISSFDVSVNVSWRVTSATVSGNSGKIIVDLTQPGHVKVSNLAPIKPQAFVDVTIVVDSQSCGDGTWDAITYTGSGFTGATFSKASTYTPPTTTVACLKLGCGDPAFDVKPQGSLTTIHLQRGQFDTNGTTDSACSDLFVYVTPTAIVGTTTVQTNWDKNMPDSNSAVFQYTVNFKATTGSNTPPAIKVAWISVGGVPDEQPALMCGPNLAQTQLPEPYAALVADNGSKIDVLPLPSVTLPSAPFSIIIGEERMLVTKVQTNTNSWFVTRQMGGTQLAAHSAGDAIMGTSFPIVQSSDGYSSSYVGRSAKMCINNLAHSLTTPTDWTATLLDDSDGWVRVGQ